MAAAPPPPAGGFVLFLHGSGGSGEEIGAEVAPYFAAPELASSVRLSFPTAPTVPIACYGEFYQPGFRAPRKNRTHLIMAIFNFLPVLAVHPSASLRLSILVMDEGFNLLCCFALWMLLKARDVVITAWFGISEVPITAKTVRDEKEVLKAVEYVHGLIDKEIASGTSPSDIFVCGLSQGGALAIASVLLYPKTLGGCVVFSGSVPLRKTFADKVSPEARKTPVLWFHGMADGLVLFEAGHAGCAFLEELGMTCEFKAYPTLGHSMIDEELQYFQQWILNRLGISGIIETARPSSPSQHKDLQ
ncbi:unnamed protein product [Urochloa decumbens]|uniref:Phospholipase/carboxylesterase/thioesterase domain-containing protein n=1 Tax=Urochloa decumbens TaxID=240449 RepID=A0ABC9F9N7_9POAL